MTRIVTTYEPIRCTATKSLPCPVCGKKLRRQRTFQMTLNPWNRNPDGTTRTRTDIAQALTAQADEWKSMAETHSRCSEVPA